MSELVLLSGGMDSTTLLAQSVRYQQAERAVGVYYGQRHQRELESAQDVAVFYGIPFDVIDLSTWGQLLKGSSLTDRTVQVPDGHYAAPTMVLTIVPNRNATMLMAAAGIAQAHSIDRVVTAVHAGDHAVYPDCRPEFIDAASRAAWLGTDHRVDIIAPFIDMTKTDIARLGHTLGVPYAKTWSCYKGGDLHCGTCGTCTERREAFTDAGLEDPTTYASA